MRENVIYPDYELCYDDYRAGALTQVRKQDDSGMWVLIPVVCKYEFDNNIDHTEQLLDFVKTFHDNCYRVALFYKCNNSLMDPERPWLKFFERDVDQRSENERLIYRKKRVNSKIKVL